MALQPPQSPQTPKTPKASHAPKTPKDAKTPKAFRSFQPPQAPPPSIAVDLLASAGSDEYVMTLGLASPFDPADYPGCEFAVTVTGTGTDLPLTAGVATYPIDTTTVSFNNTPAGEPFTIAVKVAGAGMGLVDSSSRTYPPPFSPLSLSPALWLKASSLTLTDNDQVATWPDISGNGMDATQAISGARPIFKTGIVNGRAVVRFDGVDDILGIASNIIGASFFAVVRVQNVNSYPSVIGGLLHFGNYAIVLDGASANYYPANTDFFTNGVSNTGLTFNQFVYISTVRASINDAFKFGGDAPSQGGNPCSCDIAEILIFSSELSTGDREAVEEYLAAEYAIA